MLMKADTISRVSCFGIKLNWMIFDINRFQNKSWMEWLGFDKVLNTENSVNKLTKWQISPLFHKVHNKSEKLTSTLK